MEYQVFGAPHAEVEYRHRPSAYGIAFDGKGRAAVVYCERKGFFLLGGGMDPGESEEECIRREALEETGYAVTVGEKVCIGEEYTTDLKGRPFHPVGHIYLIRMGEKVREPVESDHILTWLPVEEFQRTTFLRYQAWAMGVAWEVYQKRQRRDNYDDLR